MAIGFEFQTAVELTAQEGEKFVRTVPLQSAGKWSMVPDEIVATDDGQKCDLEYITEPFDEHTQTNQLAGCMGNIRAHASNLKMGQQIGIGTVTQLPKVVSAAPQATIGIPLDRLPLLAKISQDEVFKGLKLGVGAFPTLFGMTAESAKTGGDLLTAQHFARQAIGLLAGSDGTGHEDVEGFLMLVIGYLLGSKGLESDTKQLEYAKLLAPLMSRTNFRAMYLLVEAKVDKLLGNAARPSYYTAEHMRDYWCTAGPVRPSDKDDLTGRAEAFATWLSKVLTPEGIDLAKPVFPHGYATPDMPGSVRKGPSRQAWLLSIAYPELGLGIDRQHDPDRAGYEAVLKDLKDFKPERTDLLSPAPYASTSLGLRTKALENKSFQVSNPFENTQEPFRVILELRRLPKGTPVDEWPKYANAVREALAHLTK